MSIRGFLYDGEKYLHRPDGRTVFLDPELWPLLLIMLQTDEPIRVDDVIRITRMHHHGWNEPAARVAMCAIGEAMAGTGLFSETYRAIPMPDHPFGEFRETTWRIAAK